MTKDKNVLSYRKLSFELQTLIEKLEPLYITIDERYDIDELSEDVKVIYLPANVQDQFKKFANNKVRLFKICNYLKPAIKIKYNVKHQYSTEKYSQNEFKKTESEKTIKDFKRWILFLVNTKKDLEQEAEQNGTILDTELVSKIEENIKYLINVSSDFDNYEVVQSSFLKNYTYTMFNFQYMNKNVKRFESTQLVGSEYYFYDKNYEFIGKKQKVNIIFLADSITNKTFKSNKNIRKYLNSFDKKIVGESRDLFIKKVC